VNNIFTIKKLRASPLRTRIMHSTSLKVNYVELDRKPRGLKARRHDGTNKKCRPLASFTRQERSTDILTGEEITAEGNKNVFQNKDTEQAKVCLQF
jgi:hypothetical protein